MNIGDSRNSDHREPDAGHDGEIVNPDAPDDVVLAGEVNPGLGRRSHRESRRRAREKRRGAP